ncbi:DUF2194 domain-containing protein [Brevibacillus fortis]|uniref:DUF2194 domain-containing protein n=1 Tax=Brevibacillus fortis TaxID=2126352 RepID=UPI001FCA3959|nr:DUF2194 domain-containing protein [Brevibacillus fortis]MED1784513.1 DUF2194 domain-containing protein [Brevibacillus fortis]
MKKENDIPVKKSIYIILAFVLILGITIEVTRSQFILQVSRNTSGGSGASVNEPKQNAISQEELSQFPRERFLILHNPQDESSNEITKNFEQVLHYMKKEYDLADVKQFSQPDPAYMTIIVTIEDLGLIGNLDGMMQYAHNGGSIFFARTPGFNDSLYQIYRKLGINAMNSPIETKGIRMTSNLLIQGEDAKIGEELVSNFSIPVELNKQSKVHAVAANSVPLLWESEYGQGKFMVYNGSNLQTVWNRGLIAGAISVMNADFMYPIFNMKIMYIDDFPAPFRQGNDPNIDREYNKDIPAFYRDIWWPDMIKLAADYELTYTGAIIHNYNNRVISPFADEEGTDTNNLITYGRDLLKLGGELGIHGYNHQALTTDQEISDLYQYMAWPDEHSMSESLTSLDESIKKVFPSYAIRVYVPPSNVLGAEGREALKRSFPGIKAIASLYGESDDIQEYIQEFSVAEDGIVEMPRITFGYGHTDLSHWYMTNAITSIGVFSHFIHPDDILDKDRGHDKTWPELLEDFQVMLQDVYQQYPWLRSLTASEGGTSLESYVETDVYVKRTDNKITGYMNNFSKDMYYILRTNKKMTDLKNCTVEKIDKGVYLVQATGAKFEIGLEE